jgi:membrane-bound lytic murein transglycosylase F
MLRQNRAFCVVRGSARGRSGRIGVVKRNITTSSRHYVNRLGRMAVVSACVMLASCNHSSPAATPLLAKIRAEGKLRVVTRNAGTTYYLGPRGPLGPEYELAQDFARELGVELEIYSVDSLTDLFQEVTDGRADLAAAHLTVTPARAEIVRFGPVYQDISQLVLYRKGTPRPMGPEDLVGRHIAVVEGSSYVQTLTQLQSSLPDLHWTEVADTSIDSLLQQISHGDLDITVADSSAFELKTSGYPDVRVGFELKSDDQIAWAFHKDADLSLYNAARTFFAKMQDNGQLQAMLRRYYDREKRVDHLTARSFIQHVETRLPSYRSVFEDVAEETGIEWRLLAAMAYQESHWDPEAVSPTGVRGMMMLTEAAASDLEIDDREDVRQSILGGARYFRSVKDKIPKRIAEPDRTFMALAAYNCGFGHLEDARILTQMHGLNPDSWADVREHLPLLSDERWYPRLKRGYARGGESVAFVRNIRSYYDILIWMAPKENKVELQRASTETRRLPARVEATS